MINCKTTEQICLCFVDTFDYCDQEDEVDGDNVKQYSIEVLLQGFLFLEFVDAIREGDAERIIHCWYY